MESLYRFKHPTRSRVFYEDFNTLGETFMKNSKFVDVYKQPRSISDFTLDSNFECRAKSGGSIVIPYVYLPFDIRFTDYNGNPSSYPTINNRGISYDGFELDYFITPEHTPTRIITTIRFMLKSYGGYFSMGNHPSNFGWISVEGTDIYTSVLSSPTDDLGKIYLGIWYTVTITVNSNGDADVKVVGDNGQTYEKVYAGSVTDLSGYGYVWVGGSPMDALDGFFDYFEVEMEGENEYNQFYVFRGSGYAKQIYPNSVYVFPFNISYVDEIKYDLEVLSSKYLKFSTDGFYIEQDGMTIRVKGTDSAIKTYTVQTEGWYTISVVFYKLVNDTAIRVEIRNEDGNLIYKFNPSYSGLKKAIKNPVFSTETGKTGIIDNLEVYR